MNFYSIGAEMDSEVGSQACNIAIRANGEGTWCLHKVPALRLGAPLRRSAQALRLGTSFRALVTKYLAKTCKVARVEKEG